MRICRKHCTYLGLAHTVLAGALSVTSAVQAEPQAPNLAAFEAQTSFRVLDIPVGQLVELVGAEHGLKVNVSERLRGSVTKTQITGDHDQMLNAVASQTPIDWFTHDGILYVSSPKEEIVQFLPLKTLSLSSVEELLDQSGLDYSRHSVEPLKNEAAIKVVGPPMMVELIEAMVQLSTASQDQPKKAPSVLVRRGLHKTIEFYGKDAPAPQVFPTPTETQAPAPDAEAQTKERSAANDS